MLTGGDFFSPLKSQPRGRREREGDWKQLGLFLGILSVCLPVERRIGESAIFFCFFNNLEIKILEKERKRRGEERESWRKSKKKKNLQENLSHNSHAFGPPLFLLRVNVFFKKNSSQSLLESSRELLKIKKKKMGKKLMKKKEEKEEKEEKKKK